LKEILDVINVENYAPNTGPKGTLMSRILVVAPTESRTRLVNILREAGYAVAEADSGESALNTARSVSPELILMAIVMPDINGLEVAARLRQHLNSELPPIILLGSITPIGLDEEPLASLVNGYLDIDASSEDLLATVRSHVSIRNQQMH
jgi:CheY-like chemotaxis protein